MVRTWTIVIVTYLLVGLVLQVLNMCFVPAFRKVFQTGWSHGSMRLVVIGSLLGMFIWPLILPLGFFIVKSKKVKCPGCGARLVLMFCSNCGPVGKHALLLQEQRETRVRKIKEIKDPELRAATLLAEEEADSLVKQIDRKMSAMEKNDPARNVLSQEALSAVEGIYLRHTQPIIDRRLAALSETEARLRDAERRLAEHPESDHESTKR